MVKVIMFMLYVIFLAGCGGGNDGEPLSEEERRKSVFWQMRKPEVQLDPIEEKDLPTVYYPVKPEEKKTGK